MIVHLYKTLYNLDLRYLAQHMFPEDLQIDFDVDILNQVNIHPM